MGLIVFISYATPDSDKYRISDISAALKKYEDIDEVLYWEEHMHDDIMKYMNDNLDKCDVLLLFCSKNAMKSESVEMEWMSALKLRKKVIPIFFDESDIPPLLTTKLGVGFKPNAFEKTIDSIHSLILKKQKALSLDANPRKSSPLSADELGIEELCEHVAEAIFCGKKEVKIGRTQYWVKTYKSSGVRYVEMRPYKFMEQNPNKASDYAKMAKEGKKVLWILHGRNYYARWIDGEFTYIGT